MPKHLFQAATSTISGSPGTNLKVPQNWLVRELDLNVVTLLRKLEALESTSNENRFSGTVIIRCPYFPIIKLILLSRALEKNNLY